jgi:hypothetical protein
MVEFPTRSDSPAHYTRTLRFLGLSNYREHGCAPLVSFLCDVTEPLVRAFMVHNWFTLFSPVKPHGFSPTLNSIDPYRPSIPFSVLFRFISSFSLLKEFVQSLLPNLTSRGTVGGNWDF